jgi:hypothetical protein
MAVGDINPIALRTDRHFGVVDNALTQLTKQLQSLSFQFFSSSPPMKGMTLSVRRAMPRPDNRRPESACIVVTTHDVMPNFAMQGGERPSPHRDR